jgi:hypothetical protein
MKEEAYSDKLLGEYLRTRHLFAVLEIYCGTIQEIPDQTICPRRIIPIQYGGWATLK